MHRTRIDAQAWHAQIISHAQVTHRSHTGFVHMTCTNHALRKHDTHESQNITDKGAIAQNCVPKKPALCAISLSHCVYERRFRDHQLSEVLECCCAMLGPKTYLGLHLHFQCLSPIVALASVSHVAPETSVCPSVLYMAAAALSMSVTYC
eukprot:1158593-Pelagomonas_calceolata.AAC.3